MTRLSDTSPEAEEVLRESLRRMPLERKLQQMRALYRTAKALHAAGVLDRNPSATPADIAADWRALVFSKELVARLGDPPMEMSDDNVAVLQAVVAVLARLGIPYALGGSWASSLQGKMRLTQDADLTVEPFPGKEAVLVGSFGEDYYVSLAAAEEAVRRRSCFNIIHHATNFKVDIFVRKDRPFEQTMMARRRVHSLPGFPGVSFDFVSAEDIILLKLEWFRLGGELSEKQWTDILNVFEVQGGRLDQAYLDHWAQQLGVADLLARARAEKKP